MKLNLTAAFNQIELLELIIKGLAQEGLLDVSHQDIVFNTSGDEVVGLTVKNVHLVKWKGSNDETLD
jgi:hypothetical protein